MKNNFQFGKHWIRLSIIAVLLVISTTLSAQVYNNIVTRAHETAPINGMKIKTKIPFESRNTSRALIMPTVKIEGYNYGNTRTLNLTVSWYRSGDNFHSTTASSYGASIPKIYLDVETDGMVSIFINDKVFAQRFTVSAFYPGALPEHCTGWTIVDEPRTKNKETLVPYRNNFGGTVGIGTDKPDPEAMLDVRGKIIADEVEIKVNKTDSIPDFVFEPDYKLRTLSEVEAYITKNKHLPEIQSAKEIHENGLNLNEFQMKLLQKIEELTLYTIEQNKKQLLQEERLQKQEEIIKDLLNKINKK